MEMCEANLTSSQKLSAARCLAMGGGSGFALYLEKDLLHGRSDPCSTFQSEAGRATFGRRPALGLDVMELQNLDGQIGFTCSLIFTVLTVYSCNYYI